MEPHDEEEDYVEKFRSMSELCLMACYRNRFRSSMTVFASCMKHHTSERNSCHLNRLLIYDYA